ncbi:MAG: MlaD family protein [Gammaproteobacteria bacterium]
MHKAVLKKNYELWVIWLLPLIAALIGAWLAYKSISEAGIVIAITFNNAEGIKEEKTKIVYRGMVVGKVKEMHISEDMQHVKVMAEMSRDIADALNSGTVFWLVKPRISLTGVTGLDTLVSGNYIAMQPGEGKEVTHFQALPKPPAQENLPGLYITLVADKLGSLDRGAQVYYREIPVGEVQDYQLAEDSGSVAVKVHIAAEYSDLVKGTSRFWNASGVSVKAGVKGIDVRTESLAALIAGGIAFHTPSLYVAERAQNGDRFNLYPDFESAQVSIDAKIYFDSALSVHEGMEVKYDGYKIGSVKKLSYPQAKGKIVADVAFDPRAEKMLREGTQFWVVKPKISLTGVSGLETLIQGTYISVQAGNGKPTREFKALNKPLVNVAESDGLHVVLKADALASVERGSPVLYKKVRVGEVHDYRLDAQGKQVLIDVFIDKEQRHLVKPASRFWNASGVQVNLDTTGIQVRAGSVGTLLNGGIEFYTPPAAQGTVKAGQQFALYADYDAATDNGALMRKKIPGSLNIVLHSKQLGAIKAGTKVFYHKVPVGEVGYYELQADSGDIAIHASIAKPYRHLVKTDSRFWRSGGIDFEAGLSGVKVKTEALSAILNAGISFDNARKNLLPAEENRTFALFDDADAAKQAEGIAVRIRFELAEGLDQGTPVKYRGIKVGEITRINLADNRQGVVADVVLYGFAKDFTRSGTQFRLVGPSLGLFHTEHLDTLLKGKYIDVRPGKGPRSREFDGLLQATEVTDGLPIVLQAERLGSLKVGDRVYYRQLPVGQVTGYRLSADAKYVLIDIIIQPRYADLVRENTRFWNVSGIELDYGLFRGLTVNAETMETIIGGGVAFATPQQGMKAQARPGRVFRLHKSFEKDE